MAKKKTDNGFANRLVDLMAERKMPLRKAAKVAQVNLSTIQSWRSGAIPHDWIAVKKLASALNTTLSYLLTGEDESRSSAIPNISEVFKDGGALFDGYARISIQRLIPKDKSLRDDAGDDE